MIPNFWNNIKWFKYVEFSSPDSPESGINMNQELVEILDIIRSRFGRPIKINSGYRTPQWNTKVGGVPLSAHTKGTAVDLEIVNSSARYTVIKLALENRIKRIGLAKDFIHLDIDMNSTQFV